MGVMSISNALQSAIYSALTNDATLSAAIDGVYDFVPDNQNAFPFITIGDITLNERDTDDTNGYSAVFVVHTWSRSEGKKQAADIQNLVYGLLHKTSPALSTGAVLLMVQESQEVMRDPDGRTFHGIQNFRATLTA